MLITLLFGALCQVFLLALELGLWSLHGSYILLCYWFPLRLSLIDGAGRKI